MIDLGSQRTDVITGFTGTVTARAEYITGCTQYQVVAKTGKDGEAKSGWYDEERLKATSIPALLASERRKREDAGPQDHPRAHHPPSR